MKRKRVRKPAVRLPDVLRRLDSWRQSGAKGRRIPEPLWGAAVELARAQGVNPIAQALRLDYYDLKRRVEAREAKSSGNGASAPSFVEIEMPSIGGSPFCSIELEDGQGARLSIRLPETSSADLMALAQSLWGGRR